MFRELLREAFREATQQLPKVSLSANSQLSPNLLLPEGSPPGSWEGFCCTQRCLGPVRDNAGAHSAEGNWSKRMSSNYGGYPHGPGADRSAPLGEG